MGRVGENLVTKLELDISKELNEFSQPVFELMLKVPALEDPYPVLIEIEDNKLIYYFSGSDLAESGYGELEVLVCGPNGEVLKSATAKTKIEPSMIPSSYPGPLQKIIDDIRESISDAVYGQVIEYIDAGLNNKVDKVIGKDLSTNDFTNEKNTKLEGIEVGAEVNEIEAITLNGEVVTVRNKTAEISAVQDESYVHTDNNYTSAEKTKLANTKLVENIEVNIVFEESESPTVTLVTQNAYSKIMSALSVGNTVILTGHLCMPGETQGEMITLGNVLFNKNMDINDGETFVSFSSFIGEGESGDVLRIYIYDTDDADLDIFDFAPTEVLETKVDKIYGKGLSTNDYTSAEKTKLEGIETGAEVNEIEAITLNGTPVSVTNKTAAINAVQDNSYVHTDNNYTDSEKAKLSSVKLTEVIEANLVWTTEETPTVTLVTQNAYNKITSALTNGDEVVLAGHLFSLMEGQAEPVDVGTLLFVKSFDYDLGGEASVSFMASPSDGLFYRLEIDSSNTTAFTQTSLDSKVDKVSGKGLSTNDYTTADQNKLNGIASGAEVNVIESISYNGSPVSVVSKAVSINPDALTSLTEAVSITLETNKKYYLTLASNTSFVLPTISNASYDNQILVYLNCTADVDISFPSGTLLYGGNQPDTSTGAHELIITYNPAAGAWTVGCLDAEEVT